MELKEKKTTKAYSLSVIIITMDRTHLLLEAVNSILKQTVLPNELIVVDASKHDRNVQQKLQVVLRGRIPIKYFHTSPSTSMQRNIGAEKSSSDVVLFMDDDIILEENHIEQILRFYRKHAFPSFSGVRGNSIESLKSKKENYIYRILKRLFLLQETRNFTPAKMKRSGFALYSPVVNEVCEIEIAPAGCVSFWRSVFLKHQFDTHFVGYVLAEDKDLTWRISRDLPLYQIPTAKFVHTMGQNRLDKDQFTQQKNRIIVNRYFFKKNLSGPFLNHAAFYWALLGYLIMWTVMGLRAKNFIRLKGFFAGLTEPAKSNWP